MNQAIQSTRMKQKAIAATQRNLFRSRTKAKLMAMGMSVSSRTTSADPNPPNSEK
ncbi:MAG: hypothetical protein WCP58_02925 [bacterium]